jgi:CopG-like RHH_1 or ribbon-helix-helix domain, RHH_5
MNRLLWEGYSMDAGKMAKRINLTLSDPYHADLQRWADSRGEPLATFATYLLKLAIDDARRSGEIPAESESLVKAAKNK